MIRLHAGQLAQAEDPAEVRDAAVGRLLGWCLATAARAERRLRPYRGGLPRDSEPPPAEPTDFGGPRQALEWLVAECANLSAAVRLAYDGGRQATAWQLADAMWPLFLYRGHRFERLDVEETGLHAARACGDQYAEAKMLNRVGLTRHVLGDQDAAAELFREARTLWRRLGERDREGGSLRRLGMVAAERGDHDEAITSFLEAYEIYSVRGATRKSALALVDMGEVLTRAGRGLEAVDHLERARDLLGVVDDPYNRARVRTVLGRAHMDAGDHTSAERELRAALTAMTAIDSSAGRGQALEALGELAERCGRTNLARDRYEQALAALGEPETAAHARIRSRLADLDVQPSDPHR